MGSPSSKLRSDLDLNHVAEDELEEYKKLMDEKFNENRVRPGDADYEYDKRVRLPLQRQEHALLILVAARVRTS